MIESYIWNLLAGDRGVTVIVVGNEQILVKAVYISDSANTSEKGINTTILPPAK